MMSAKCRSAELIETSASISRASGHLNLARRFNAGENVKFDGVASATLE
jgi:hypothetical protein